MPDVRLSSVSFRFVTARSGIFANGYALSLVVLALDRAMPINRVVLERASCHFAHRSGSKFTSP